MGNGNRPFSVFSVCVFLCFLVLPLTSVMHNLIGHFATVNVYLTEYSIFMSHLHMNGPVDFVFPALLRGLN